MLHVASNGYGTAPEILKNWNEPNVKVKTCTTLEAIFYNETH